MHRSQRGQRCASGQVGMSAFRPEQQWATREASGWWAEASTANLASVQPFRFFVQVSPRGVSAKSSSCASTAVVSPDWPRPERPAADREHLLHVSPIPSRLLLTPEHGHCAGPRRILLAGKTATTGFVLYSPVVCVGARAPTEPRADAAPPPPRGSPVRQGANAAARRDALNSSVDPQRPLVPPPPPLPPWPFQPPFSAASPRRLIAPTPLLDDARGVILAGRGPS